MNYFWRLYDVLYSWRSPGLTKLADTLYWPFVLWLLDLDLYFMIASRLLNRGFRFRQFPWSVRWRMWSYHRLAWYWWAARPMMWDIRRLERQAGHVDGKP